MGRAACDAADDQPVAEGAVGAGAGATVGKILGPAGSMQGGIGSWAEPRGDYTVAALVALNAFGDVLAEDGSIVAGARTPDGSFLNTSRQLRSGQLPAAPVGTNTTLAVVATDAPLDRTALSALAQQSASAFGRRISPVFTQFDGDIIFALSTAQQTRELPPIERLGLAAAAQFALEMAIERSVSGGMESRRTESGRTESGRTESA
jgi:L-aminopeptidase/D-esterase-like protein